MADSAEHPHFCGRCGKPLQETDRFCGSCGASVLPSTSEDTQVIPQPVAAAQGAAYGRSRAVGGVVVAAVALLVIGGAAAFAFGGGLGLLGASGEGQQQTGRPDPSSAGQSEPTTPQSEYDDEEEDAILQEFAREYDTAARAEDWDETYSMLDEYSQGVFSEDEWAEVQQAVVDDEGIPAPLESVTVDQNEEVTDVPARLTLNYEDDTDETISAGIPSYVTDDSDDGVPKRTLTEDEIEDLREYLPAEETTINLPDAEAESEARIEAFVEKYYEAVEQGDWVATYYLLADATSQQFTEDEWVEAQEIRQSAEGGSSSLASVGEIEDVAEFVVSVELVLADGTTGETSVFVPPNGEEPRRILSNDDVAYLRGLLEEETGL